MLKDALVNICSHVIMEKAIKNSERPEVTRVFNDSFVAIEKVKAGLWDKKKPPSKKSTPNPTTDTGGLFEE